MLITDTDKLHFLTLIKRIFYLKSFSRPGIQYNMGNIKMHFFMVIVHHTSALCTIVTVFIYYSQ